MKTFVAPVAGGPHAGSLVRQEIGIERWLAPPVAEGDMVYNEYLLMNCADGSRVWKFQEPEGNCQ